VAKLFHDYLMQSGKGTARWLFIALIFMIQTVWLETRFIVVAGYNVRWPAIIMMSWMFFLFLLITFLDNGKES
jgi:hypothetical protein